MSARVEGFAAVPNWFIRRPETTMYQIAVYAALSSHTGPGGVHPSQRTLAAEAHCSERQVRIVLAELVDLGVVEIVRRRRRGDGRATTMSNGYVLHPHGRLGEDEESVNEVPAPDATTSEATGTESTSYRHTATKLPAQDDNPDLFIEEEPVKKNPEKKSPVVPRGDAIDELFVEAWELWPAPRRGTTKKSGSSWRTAVKTVGGVRNAGVILDGIRRDVGVWRTWPRSEVQFIPLLSTWLNQERWSAAPPLPRGERRTFAQQKQDNALALVARYQEEERRAQVGSGEGSGVRVGGGSVGAERALGRGVA